VGEGVLPETGGGFRGNFFFKTMCETNAKNRNFFETNVRNQCEKRSVFSIPIYIGSWTTTFTTTTHHHHTPPHIHSHTTHTPRPPTLLITNFLVCVDDQVTFQIVARLKAHPAIHTDKEQSHRNALSETHTWEFSQETNVSILNWPQRSISEPLWHVL